MYDTAELIPLLENGTALNLLAGLGLTGLAASHILVYRHFLLLLNFVRTLRTVFLRYLRHLLPAAPALCSTPRTATAAGLPLSPSDTPADSAGQLPILRIAAS
ncbi:hypothetical protein [Microbulbifer halophilus]|uniref:hypothetical protein n=1 Tax=Microbulbifer halophilus TaxID=453963 RepID=UPI00360D96F8